MNPLRVLGERIKQKRKALGLTQQALAEAIGVSMHSVFRWESGDRVPDADALVRIAEVLGTTVSFLMGEDQGGGIVGPFFEVIELPVLSAEITACCGDGTPILELTARAEKTVLFPRDRIGRIDDLRPPFAINSDGDSMEGFGIPEGSLVAVNPAEEVRTGNIALVCIGDSVAFKKVYSRPSGYELASSDGRAPIQITKEDVECGWFKILGRGQGAIVGLDHNP